MDRIALREKIELLFHKYKYVLLILALGFVLMAIPEREEQPQSTAPTETQVTEKGIADQLEEILTQIEGVGKVSVLLTEATGAETLYQTDEDSSASEDSQSLRIETVIISDSDRGEQGLVRRVNPPTYLGAIVVCQGADRPSIQLAVVEAVANATGISADRITVLKMK